MKEFYKIFNQVSIQNTKIYNLKTTAFCLIICSKISNIISPIFIIFKTDPNKITYFNFLLATSLVTIILFLETDLIYISIFLYFLCCIIDFCDGTVARYYKITSYYGKFIDGLNDIFLKSFLILSLAFYSYKIFNDFNLLIFGCIASILTSFDTFILDRYSAIVRWYNSEKKTNILPYVKKKFLFRPNLILNDLFIFLFGSMLFTKDNLDLFYYNFIYLFFIVTISAIQNLSLHIFLSYKYLKNERNKK